MAALSEGSFNILKKQKTRGLFADLYNVYTGTHGTYCQYQRLLLTSIEREEKYYIGQVSLAAHFL